MTGGKAHSPISRRRYSRCDCSRGRRVCGQRSKISSEVAVQTGDRHGVQGNNFGSITWDRCPWPSWSRATNVGAADCTYSHSASHTERRWSRESLRMAPRRSVWWWWRVTRGHSSPSLCCRSRGCNSRGTSRPGSPFRVWSCRSRRSAGNRTPWCSPGAPPRRRLAQVLCNGERCQWVSLKGVEERIVGGKVFQGHFKTFIRLNQMISLSWKPRRNTFKNGLETRFCASRHSDVITTDFLYQYP